MADPLHLQGIIDTVSEVAAQFGQTLDTNPMHSPYVQAAIGATQPQVTPGTGPQTLPAPGAPAYATSDVGRIVLYAGLGLLVVMLLTKKQ